MRHVSLRAAGALLLAGALLAAPSAHAQERGADLPRRSPNASVSQTIGVTEVTITYGRPYVRERDIFGGLVPYGEVWRAGANEATTISFSDDVRVQGVPLNAGTYAFFAIPHRGFWRLLFNTEANQWGAYNYEPTNDALRVGARPREAPFREMMTFTFEDVTANEATAVLHWDTVRVPFSIRVDTDRIVRERARARVPEAEDWQLPHRYAQYALRNDLYPAEAIGWAGRSVTLAENYYNLSVLARLYAQTEDYEEAIDVGERAVRAGKAMENTPDDLSTLEQQLAEWRAKR